VQRNVEGSPTHAHWGNCKNKLALSGERVKKYFSFPVRSSSRPSLVNSGLAAAVGVRVVTDDRYMGISAPWRPSFQPNAKGRRALKKKRSYNGGPGYKISTSPDIALCAFESHRLEAADIRTCYL